MKSAFFLFLLSLTEISFSANAYGIKIDCQHDGDVYPNPTFSDKSLVSVERGRHFEEMFGYVAGTYCRGGYEDVTVCLPWGDRWLPVPGFRPAALRTLAKLNNSSCPAKLNPGTDEEKVACFYEFAEQHPRGCRVRRR